MSLDWQHQLCNAQHSLPITHVLLIMELAPLPLVFIVHSNRSFLLPVLLRDRCRAITFLYLTLLWQQDHLVLFSLLLHVWDALTGCKQHTFEGHKAPVYSVFPHHKETYPESTMILLNFGAPQWRIVLMELG